LQAAEKVIKSCIREKGSIPKNIHDLSRLCATAVAVGVPGVDSALIASIQCSPDVRYDSTLVGKMDAVEAHYAALTICGALAPVVKRTTSESDVFDYEFPLSGGNKLDGILLGYSPPTALIMENGQKGATR